MSANRNRLTRRSRSASDTSRNDLRNCAWRVVRYADLGYAETILAGESYEVYERVLTTVQLIGYGSLTLARIADTSQSPISRSHFQKWIGQAKNARQTFARAAAYGLVLELQRLLGYRPQFGMVSNWVFLGRFRRNHTDLPLTAMQKALPQEDDDFVDLWGSADSRQVMVRYGRGQFDYVPGHVDQLDCADSHVREAFRRLAKEAAPAAV